MKTRKELMPTSARQALIALYLEYRNDFLSVERFAEFHEMEADDMHPLLEVGNKLANSVWEG
jgi:hypothetical protein